jgi:hypothetical protein
MTGQRVLELADTMEKNGLPEDFIRRAGKHLIVEGDDPALGDFHKGEDGEWKLEVSDEGLRYPPSGSSVSTVGAQAEHPDLFEGLPQLKETELHRVKGMRGGGSFRPGNPEFGVPPLIQVNQTASARKGHFAHELQHNASFEEGFARGGEPDEFKDGGALAHLRLPGETPTDAYRRLLGEWDANVTKERMDMSAQQRRDTPIEETVEELQRRRIIAPGPAIIKFYRNPTANDLSLSRSMPEPPRDPSEPSAFEQAQEEHWGEAGRRGFAREQAIERQNTPRAQPQRIEQLSREDQLGRTADALAENVSALEKSMRLQGSPPSEIANAIETRFGDQVGKVDPKDIADRTAWWHVATDNGGSRGKGGRFDPWSKEERDILARGMKEQLSYKDIAKQITDFSGRVASPESIYSARQNFGWPGIRKNSDMGDLWPREANVMVAHLYDQKMPVGQMAKELSNAFGKDYSPKTVGDQLERLLRKPGTLRGEQWQPEATDLLKDELASGTPAHKIAELIQKETGQVVTRAAVLGKANRLREQQMRENLAEDLAKSGKNMPERTKILRAFGLPVVSDHLDHDRIMNWGY